MAERFEAYLRAAEKKRVTGVIIYQENEKILEKHFDDNCRRNQYSASKSFTSAAVGLAVREGLVRLEEKLADCFPEEMPDDPCEELCEATVRDLLTRALGQKEGCLFGSQRPFLPEDDWVRYALSRPFSDRPGTRFLYNNAGPYLAGRLVQKRAGCDLVSYLTPRLFAKLGIRRPTWEVDPQGYTFGAGGLFLTVEELARFGLMYLNGGVYEGQRILPEEWVRESAKVQVENHGEKDGGCGYGYLFWHGRHDSFRADGKYGQVALILPEKRAVVAYNAESRAQQELLDIVWEHVWPLL